MVVCTPRRKRLARLRITSGPAGGSRLGRRLVFPKVTSNSVARPLRPAYQGPRLRIRPSKHICRLAETKFPLAKRGRLPIRAPRTNDARRRDFVGLPLGIRTGVKQVALHSGIWKKPTRGAKGRFGRSRRRNRVQSQPPSFTRPPRKVLCSAAAGGRRGERFHPGRPKNE